MEMERTKNRSANQRQDQQSRQDRQEILKRRTYAFAVDFALITLLCQSLFWGYSNFFNSYMLFISPKVRLELYNDLPLIKFPIFSMVFLGYFLFSYFMSNGKSLGKVLLGLQVVSNDHDHTRHGVHQTSLGLQACLWRTLGYYFCYLFFGIPFLISFCRQDGRGIPDWPSKTHVAFSGEDCLLEEAQSPKASKENSPLVSDYPPTSTPPSQTPLPTPTPTPTPTSTPFDPAA